MPESATGEMVSAEAITAIPAEAIEAAAKIMYADAGGVLEDRWRYRTAEAERILTAAAPLLRAPLVAEVKRLRDQVEELTESRGTERLVHHLQEQRLREDHDKAPRWDEDPIVIEHGWLDGRCARCGEAQPVDPEVKRLTEDNAELATKLEALREHTLDSNPALRTLHNNAVAYFDAVNALHEVTGAPLSTTIGYLIRQRFLAIVPTAEAIEAGKNAERSDRAEVKRLTAIVEAVRELATPQLGKGTLPAATILRALRDKEVRPEDLLAALSSVPGLSEASGDLG